MAINILHITRSQTGGVRKHTLQIYFGLDNRIFSQFFVTNLSTSDSTFTHNADINSIPVYDLPLRMSLNPIYLFRLLAIVRIVRTKDIDIVHGHGPIGGFFARFVSLLSGTPCVYTPHGGTVHAYSGAPQKRWTIIMERALYRFTNLFLFESQYSLLAFSQRIMPNNTKYLLNYNGVDLFEKRTRSPGEIFTIGGVGRLHPEKGYDILIKAMAILIHDRKLELRCRIYGEGSERTKLKDLVEKNNLGSNVLLEGFVTDISSIMDQVDVVVHPSRTDSLPYTPLEAISYGVPMIVSTTGGLPELITNHLNGLTTKLDPLDLADNIETLYMNPQLREQLTDNARETIKTKFSLQNMLSTIESTYKRLCSCP